MKIRNLRISLPPSNIIAVGISTMLVAISTSALYSISPFYLKEVLKINLVNIGLVEQVSEALSQFCRLFSGIIGDYLKKNKPMFLLGTIFSALARPFFILANGIWMVAASKAFDRIGNGISATPRDAYVAQHSPANKKGAYLGVIMTFKTFGCMSPFVVAYILKKYSNFDYRTLLILIAIPSFLAIFVCLFYMKEKKEDASKEASQSSNKEKEPRNSFKISDVRFLPNIYWLFLGVMTFFMLARTPESYMLLNLEETGLPKWFCTATIGFFNLVSLLVSYPSGWLSDKIGRNTVLIISFITLTVSLFCFSMNTCLFGVLGVVFWGIQRSTSQILSVACIADIVPKNILGTAIGLQIGRAHV